MVRAGFILVALALLLCSCGGGLTSAIDSTGQTETEFTLKASDITSNSLEGTDYVDATVTCTSHDLFGEKCAINSVVITSSDLGADYSVEIPLGLSLGHKETATISIPIADDATKELAPLVYLRDYNPSTALTDWVIAKEIIGTPKVIQIAVGYEDCRPDPNNPGKQICNPGKHFSGFITGPVIPGTIQVLSGTQKLDETQFGLLTGSGSGYITYSQNGNVAIDVTFSSGVGPDDPPVLVAYLAGDSRLKSKVEGQMRILYGDLSLSLGDYDTVVSDNGTIYGLYNRDDNSITWIKPLQFKGTPLIAGYETGPLNVHGGEIVGSGDGGQIYDLKTRYPFIKDGTLKVFTADQIGSVTGYDKYSGRFTVKFNQPVVAGAPIKASYVTYKATVTFTVTLRTASGSYSKNVRFTLNTKG